MSFLLGQQNWKFAFTCFSLSNDFVCTLIFYCYFDFFFVFLTNVPKWNTVIVCAVLVKNIMKINVCEEFFGFYDG